MSLSKIIRQGDQLRPMILEPVQSISPWQEEPFKAVPLGWEPESPGSASEQVEETIPMIPEQEALARIQEAFEEGLSQGKLQAQADLSTVSEALALALGKLGGVREQLMQESEEDLLKLAVAIARKVMHKEVELDPGLLSRTVRAAIEFASAADEIVVRLNRQEYQLVAEDPEFTRLLSENRRILLKGDPALPPAGCLVETVRGTIDAGFEAQLDDILRRLMEEKSTRKEEPVPA